MGRKPKARMIEMELIGVTNCNIKHGDKIIPRNTEVRGDAAYEMLGRGHAELKTNHILASIIEDVKAKDVARVAREKRAQAKAKVELRKQRDENHKAENLDHKGALLRAEASMVEGITNA